MVRFPISISLLTISVLQCSAHQEEATTQTSNNLSKKRNLSSNTPSPTWLDYPSPEDSLELYDDDEEGDEKLASLEDELEVLKYDLAEIMDEVDIVEEEIENTIEEENVEDYGELEPLSDTLIVPLMDEEDTNGNTDTDTTTKREKHKERRKKSTLGPPQKKTGGHKQKHNELQKARRKHHKETRANRIKKNQATHGIHNIMEAQADQNIEPLVSHTIDMNIQTASTKAAKEYPLEDTASIQEQQIAEEETMKRLIRKKEKIMEEKGLESMIDGKARKLQHNRGRR